MDYLTKLTNFYQKNFDKTVKGISSHADFTIEDGEDVVQDGMVKGLVAIENGNELEDVGDFFLRHMTQARINHYNRYIKQAVPLSEMVEEPEVQEIESFFERMSHFDLTPIQKEVLSLKLKGYTDREVKSHLPISANGLTRFMKELARKSAVGGKVETLSRI